jgi:hypothetical protein
MKRFLFFVLVGSGMVIFLRLKFKSEGQNPLSELALPTLAESQFEATVQEHIATGAYHYIRTQTLGRERWIVSLHPAEPGEVVRVTVFGTSPRFESHRLNRVFSPLLFSTITHPPFSPGPLARDRNESL